MNGTALEHPLYRAEQLREFDRRAIQEHGIPGYTLMTRAATAALGELRAQWPRAQRIVVVCGAGNNAGDGYVLARLARATGLEATVLWLREPHELQGDAQTAWTDADAAGVGMQRFTASGLQDADIVVDAVLGIGLERPLSDEWAAAVAAINTAAAPVLALDVPSGLQADTGAVPGVAVRAALTVSFIAPKLGLFTGAGADHVGQVRSANLDLPASVFDGTAPAAWQIDAAFLRTLLPPRRRTCHKGDFGHVLVVGGRPGLSGAARLAAEAAARSGAGWVSVATHPAHANTINTGRSELMCHAVNSAEALEPLLARATVVAVGPGLGRDRWAETLLAELWDSPVPLILDADALNLLAQAPRRREAWILTPHPGEAARLLGTTAAAVQADRPAAAAALQARFGGVVVLKGNGTLISDGRRVRLSPAGNPGMASAGMGDVLTGIIAGLVAQGLALPEAAAAGVVAHGLAGDAAARTGERGLLAGDLLPELRQLLNPAP